MVFEIFARRGWRGRRWFWHLKAANHEIVCSGQASGYANKNDVLAAIDLLVQLESAPVRERR